MNVSAWFLSLCILYTDVLRIVIGREIVKFPHETYVQVPDPAELEMGLKRTAFTTKAKGSLISLTNVLTVDLFANEPDIQIVSFEDNRLYCVAIFLFQSKKIAINLLRVPPTCTSPSKVISLPPIGWRAKADSGAAVSYHEGTLKHEDWTKIVTIKTVLNTEYVLSEKSQQKVRKLWLGSGLLQMDTLIGIRAETGSFTIVDNAIFQELADYISERLAKKNQRRVDNEWKENLEIPLLLVAISLTLLGMLYYP